jgi:hypothetical protein
MSEIHADRQRQRAAALAEHLAPFIEKHFPVDAPPPAPVRPRSYQYPPALVAAMAAVARASMRVEQEKFTAGERRARGDLLAAGKRLHREMQKSQELRNALR